MFELRPVDEEILPGATTAQILHVDMNVVLGEYNLPMDCPEWRWVAENASFTHRGNGVEQGVWEFVLNLSRTLEDIPEKLYPYIVCARQDNFAYIIFYQ